MRDIIKTQNGKVLCSPVHLKLFQMISSDSNFIYRAEMASSLANIPICDNANASISKEQFEEAYKEELMELLNDNDNIV